MRPALHLPLALLLGILVRYPFWVEALHTPVDGDTAIVGLMAREPLSSATLWGQPYGSPVESWLVAPVLGVVGHTRDGLRWAYFLLGLGLIPVAYFLAGRLHPWAALPAATLLACPPPYLLMLGALPPPLYPTSLLLQGLMLLAALSAADAACAGRGGSLAAAAWGSFAGLASWTHLMAASTVLVSGAWLAWWARRRPRVWATALVALVVAGGPLWWRLASDPRSLDVVRVSDRHESFGEHAVAVARDLPYTLGGLLGTHVPVIPDDAEAVLDADGWVRAGLVTLYGLGSLLALRAAWRSGGVALLLVADALLALAAFPFPLRSGPHAIRFLTPVYLPLAALLAWGPLSPSASLTPRRGASRAFVLVLALASLHLAHGLRLLAAWRTADRAEAPFLLPDLQPVVAALDAAGVRHAYASYGPAWRLTFETGGRIVASQPWNERFRHYPLPLLDEVRFAKNVAWVLTPGVPSDLPAPQAFEHALLGAGGHWRRVSAGAAAVYLGFVPPFDPGVVPWPEAGPLGDGSLASGALPPVDRPSEFVLPEPTALDGLTLVAPLDGPRLARGLDVEVSADGVAFERVASRRPRREREDLRWANGHPQYVLEHDLLAVPLEGRSVRAVRLVPTQPEEWGLGQILLHPAQPPERRRPWAEWLDPDLGWESRWRELDEAPLPDREDWYSRLLIASRHANR